MKKILSVLLAFIFVFSCFPVIGLTATAETTKYFKVGTTEYATFAEAQQAVVDAGGEGTIYLINDIETTSRILTDNGNALTGSLTNLTIDGQGYEWKNSTSNNSAIRFDTEGCTYTLTNIDFVSASNCQVVQTIDSRALTLVLGSGITFTRTDSTESFTNAAVMLGNKATLKIDGAVFDMNAPAIVIWWGNDHTIELIKGTLSNGNGKAAIYPFSEGEGRTVKISGTLSDILVKENMGNATGAATTRQINIDDITGANSIVNATGAAYDTAALANPYAVFSVDADNIADGKTAGTYTFKNAVANVKDGGTITLAENIETFSRITDFTAKNLILDGNGKTWTHSVTNDSAVRLKGAFTYEVKNLTFETTKNCQIIQTIDGHATTVKLGEGLTVTQADSTAAYTNGAVMLGYNGTLIVDGAVFNLNAPAVACWTNGTHNIVLNKGTLSTGTNAGGKTGAVIDGHGVSDPCDITVNGTKDTMKVNTYAEGAFTARALTDADITAANRLYTIGTGNDYTGVFTSTAVYAFQVGTTKYTSMTKVMEAHASTDPLVIDMIDDFEGSTDITGKGGASITINGNGYTWKVPASDTASRFCLRVGVENQTVSITNLTFDFAGAKDSNSIVLQLSEKNGANLMLGEGVVLKNTGEVAVIAGIMQQVAKERAADPDNNVTAIAAADTTVTVSGATFDLNAPSIKSWGHNGGDAKVVLNSGTFRNAGDGVLAQGHDATATATVTFNGTKATLLVKDGDATATRAFMGKDIGLTATYLYGNETDIDATYLESTAGYLFEVVGGNKYKTFADALANVQNGGTIKLLDNIVSTERFTTDSVANLNNFTSLTIDGAKADGTGNYTWTNLAEKNSALRFDTAGCTFTLKNIDFKANSNCQTIQTKDNKNVTVVLGEGVTFSREDDTASFTNAVVMLGNNGKLVIDGAQFNLKAPVVVSWGSSVHYVELKKGTLSTGVGLYNGGSTRMEGAIITDGNGTTTVTFVGMQETVTVKENGSSRALAKKDIMTAGLTLRFESGTDYSEDALNGIKTTTGIVAVGVQQNLTKEDDLRLVVTVDSLEYYMIGADITWNNFTIKGTQKTGGHYNAATQKVYTSLIGEEDGEQVTYTAADFGNHTYISGIKLRGIKAAVSGAIEGNTSATFVIRPWIKTLDGEILYGEAQTYVFTPAS